MACFVSRLLKFGHGNAKLPNSTMTFSLPSGHTCPAALLCHSQVNRLPIDGNHVIQDGPHTKFRCYAATEELRPSVRNARWYNFDLIKSLKTADMTTLFQQSITLQRRTYTERVRWFVAGDCFSPTIRDAIIQTANSLDGLLHYFYTKNLPLFVGSRGGLLDLPDNLVVTASWGGKYDFLLAEGMFPRTARVVHTHTEAEALGLPIDYSDSYAYQADPIHFAHLSHGTQPAGSAASIALHQRKRDGQFTGYSTRTVHA
jgi:hypothetical protein